MQKRVVRVFLIISAVALVQIFSTVILARNLTKADMGFYRLVLTIAELAAIFAIMGLHGSILRFFSRQQPQDYDWKRYSFTVLTCCAFLSLTIIICAGRFYLLKNKFIFFAALIGLSALLNMFFSSILRATRRYELAIFLARLNFLIFFLLLTILMAVNRISVLNALVLFTFAAILGAVLILITTFKKVPSGNNDIPDNVFKEGLIFFGILMASILILRADQLFIGKMLGYAQLATYTVVLSTMRIFEFGTDALHCVLVPHLAKVKIIKTNKMVFSLAVVAIVIGGFYIFAGKPLIHFLFAGKYDQGIYLLPFFIGSGMLKIMYVLPVSIVGARAKTESLKHFFYFCCIIVVLNLVLNYLLIPAWGLRGAATAKLLSWTIATPLSFFIVREYLFKKERNKSA